MSDQMETIGIVAILLLAVSLMLFVPELVGSIDIQNLETSANTNFSGGTETFIQMTPILFIILLFLLAYMTMDGRGDSV